MGGTPDAADLQGLANYSLAIQRWHNIEGDMVVGMVTGRGEDMMSPWSKSSPPEFCRLHYFRNDRSDEQFNAYARGAHPDLGLRTRARCSTLRGVAPRCARLCLKRPGSSTSSDPATRDWGRRSRTSRVPRGAARVDARPRPESFRSSEGTSRAERPPPFDSVEARGEERTGGAERDGVPAARGRGRRRLLCCQPNYPDYRGRPQAALCPVSGSPTATGARTPASAGSDAAA